jgi:hypothetical protein
MILFDPEYRQASETALGIASALNWKDGPILIYHLLPHPPPLHRSYAVQPTPGEMSSQIGGGGVSKHKYDRGSMARGLW